MDASVTPLHGNRERTICGTFGEELCKYVVRMDGRAVGWMCSERDGIE